jgi:transcription antitermination factor NusG
MVSEELSRSWFVSQAWHVAVTQPYAGELAKQHLMRQGFTIFNPVCCVRRVVRGKLEETERPYLPGYIFVMFDVCVDRWQAVNSTRGVKGLLGNGERPYPIKQSAMDILWNEVHRRSIVEADAAVARMTPSVGSVVKVMSGVLTGLEGVVAWSRGDRVKALFGMLGGSPVEFKADCLEVVG